MNYGVGAAAMGAIGLLASTAWGQVAVVFTSNVEAPVAVAYAPGDASRVFVLGRFGKITIHDATTGAARPGPFVDLLPLVCCSANANMVGLAFDPDYAHNGYFYVHYQGVPTESVVSRYRVTSDPDVADANSGVVILKTPRSAFGHNGGAIGFSPVDGYLYVPTGDSGNGAVADPANAAQNLASPLGKVLRVDVGGDDFPLDADRNYRVPATNPFVGIAGAMPEIWALGHRNPYQSTFDRMTGDYYVADVGQDLREEVNVQPANSAGGLNYGWKCVEGDVCSGYGGCDCMSPQLVSPIHVYDHTVGCSIAGGRVYRGSALEDLRGWYVYSDYCSGIVHGVRRVGNVTEFRDLTATMRPPLPGFAEVTSIGDDANGELYITAIHNNVGGAVYKIVANAPCPADVDDGTGTGTPDGGVTIDDLLFYLAMFELGVPGADLDNGSGTGTPDGGVTIDDLLFYLSRFEQGC